MNVADVLTRCAEHFSSKPICYFKNNAESYDTFVDQTRRLTTALIEMGAREGNRIALLSPNRPEWLISFFAIVGLGAVVVPINPALSAKEVASIVNHSAPTIVIVDADLAHLLDFAAGAPTRCVLGIASDSQWHRLASASTPALNFASMQENDPALILYTSGTTGDPKGVVLSHGGQLFAVEMFGHHLGFTPDDTSLVTGPLAFIFHSVLHALVAFNRGANIVLLERFHPELAGRAIERHLVTIVMAVPTAYVMLLNWLEGQQCDFSSLRYGISGGSSFPAILARRARNRLGVPVFDLWGMTECTPITSYNPAVDKDVRPDSCGRALPRCSVRVVDDDLNDLPADEVGEILLTSPSLMLGYYNNAAATAEAVVDGWVRSGDLGKLDADGFLYIIGRKKDMIIRGGANIYPVDIEEILYAHSAVGECAVVGYPDSIYGEVVKAFVVLKEGHEATMSDISEHCRRAIAEYKVPSIIEFIDNLPKGPTGKVLRRRLREM